jgi:hypothetical protein
VAVCEVGQILPDELVQFEKLPGSQFLAALLHAARKAEEGISKFHDSLAVPVLHVSHRDEPARF